MFAQLLIAALLVQTPPCTVAGLKLKTTAMSESDSWALAQKRWGADAKQMRFRRAGDRYTFVAVGAGSAWIIGDLAQTDPLLVGTVACPNNLCYFNAQGSWRKLWNSIWIAECLAGK